MKPLLFALSLTLGACADSGMELDSAADAGVGDAAVVEDVGNPGADDLGGSVDAAQAAPDMGSVPIIEPVTVAPCATADCWETVLGGPPCMVDTHAEDYSSGNYNVHAYATMAWEGTPTRITVAATGGAWEPVIIVNTLSGTTLFDGEVALQSAGLMATASGAADVTVTSDVALPLVVYVTSRAVLDSAFVERIPTDATYPVEVQSDCGERLTCTVNGNNVRDPACAWLHYVGRNVVGLLPGTRDEQLDTASLVGWWALKEGVMFLQNPIVYSNCNFPDGDARIGPLDSCVPNRAWQVGLSGVQVPYHTDEKVEGVVADIYPGRALADVLRATAVEAQLDAADVDAVVASTGTLRRSWFLRNSAVGFVIEAPVVKSECVDDTRTWCYGTGWDTTTLYAPNRAAALGAIDDVRALLDALAP